MDFNSPTLTKYRYGLATALPLVMALVGSPAFAQSTPSSAPQSTSMPSASMQPADPSAAPMAIATPGFGARDDGRPALSAPPTPNLTVSGITTPLGDNEAAFTANTLDYDYKAHQVVATGDVRMVRQGNRLRADKVVWNRDTDQVHAIGNVAIANPQGDVSYGDDVVLTNSMKDGVVQDMLLVLENGGRMAAMKGVRKDGVYTLSKASYTPCDVTTSKGCPKNPIWKITAVRVIYDPAKHRLSYRDARLTFLGVPIMWLPAFSHPDGSGDGGSSGLLVPNITYNKRNGLLVAQPYYRQFASNRDLTVTPYIYTAVAPMLEAEYRSLGPKGAWRVQGYLTDSTRSPNDTTAGSRDVRGYIEANGTFQLGPDWTISASLRAVTDKTFLQRYDLNYDDRLRSTVKAERIDSDSYLSIAGWEFETLVPGAKQSAEPIAIPAIDYRLRVPENLLGGSFTLQANTLGITRTQGEDMQRAFVSAQWEKWLLTPLGQQVTFTALGRGDLYHSSDNADTTTLIYQGQPGWQTRAIAAAAVDVRWPFVGDFMGGTQTLIPRVQVVASPHTKNLAIPNEDSRAIDLDDTNLFAINRFPGYDRWEDGTRVTFGAEYTLDVPHFSLRSQIGESYRLSDRSTILPDGTGLSDKLSDIVARATVRYGSFVSVTERVRVDHDSFAIRSNELDATLGSQQTYLEVGYLDLNRHISPTIEDLRDHQEVRLGARLAIGKRWSLFGSTTLDLTGNKNDPTLDPEFTQDVDPVQSRVGFDYSDDCFELSVNWRRDFTSIGDARRGSTIQFRLVFKNLGR